jgi:RNA polymerase sigma factor (sigma-70 family)
MIGAPTLHLTTTGTVARTEPRPSETRSSAAGPASWSSLRLLRRAREGDQAALDALFARQLSPLLRWAHGRLPQWVRTAADTADMVQDALLQTFRRLDRFEPRGQRALQAYLRRAIQNRITDEIRRGARIPADEPEAALTEPTKEPSPLDDAIRAEAADRYRAALDQLRPEDRLLIVGRIELGYSYEQLALVSGRVTPDATRVALRRALVRLAQTMAHA